MPEYDESKNRMTLKLVYYGPALSGKTSNLTRLHDLLRPELKGEMMMLDTKNDRTLFFDMLPVGLKAPSGLLIKIKLYTVPGQVAHDSTRKAVLSRADGVVFVADSQLNQRLNNAESFENLADNANKVGLDFEKMPLVIQFNKRDLPQIETEQAINERWLQTGWPILFASAISGAGVLETFVVLLDRVYEIIDKEYALADQHQLSKQNFISGMTGAA
ncbi:MAG: mutual gliding-motility protein MglA [Pseudomonadota bacterium]|nr:mutual gliding-motility protein MglA [Pseudomonadota bacterium]